MAKVKVVISEGEEYPVYHLRVDDQQTAPGFRFEVEEETLVEWDRVLKCYFDLQEQMRQLYEPKEQEFYDALREKKGGSI